MKQSTIITAVAEKLYFLFFAFHSRFNLFSCIVHRFLSTKPLCLHTIWTNRSAMGLTWRVPLYDLSRTVQNVEFALHIPSIKSE